MKGASRSWWWWRWLRTSVGAVTSEAVAHCPYSCRLELTWSGEQTPRFGDMEGCHGLLVVGFVYCVLSATTARCNMAGSVSKAIVTMSASSAAGWSCSGEVRLCYSPTGSPRKSVGFFQTGLAKSCSWGNGRRGFGWCSAENQLCSAFAGRDSWQV